MSKSLTNCEILLSKELGDYWAGTTTSNGAADGTTLVDTALKAKANDWVTDETYDQITEGTYNGEERKASSLSNSTGTLTVLAHGGQIVSGIDYRIHRLFEASEKRRALVAAAKNSFSICFRPIWDKTLVAGNRLDDGSFESWTSSSALTSWAAATLTVTQTNTSLYYKHGLFSAKLSATAGKLTQSVLEFDDLKYLAGRNVTFTVQGWCNTASCLRIAIYDGTTYTYSDYHDGDSAWTEANAPLEVSATIKDRPSTIEFIIYHAVAIGISYVDDARVISGRLSRIYIGGIGLAQNKPHKVSYERTPYNQIEPWVIVRGIKVDKDGYLYLPSSVPMNRQMKIEGIGYLDFLLSGVSSTDWTATIELDSPQTEILIAEAALYLYTWMSQPNYETGSRKDYQQMIGYWKQEVEDRKNKFGMEPTAGATVNWGFN